MLNRKLLITLLVIGLSLPFAFAPATYAWGEEGHRFVNGVAAQHLPEDMPAFFKNAAARLTFLGPEPDRWRDTKELYKALSEVNGPDHFIDIDKPENFDALPGDRYLYADWLRGQGKDPKDIGFLPYSILEDPGAVQIVARPAALSRARSNRAEHNLLCGSAWALRGRRIAAAAYDDSL
jgi:hypothetical protein